MNQHYPLRLIYLGLFRFSDKSHDVSESVVSIRGSGLDLGETRLIDPLICGECGERDVTFRGQRCSVFRLSYSPQPWRLFDLSPFGIVMDRNSPSKLRRAAKACVFCRRRKVSQLRRGYDPWANVVQFRCDNERPTCSSCKTYAQECAYVSRPEKPRYVIIVNLRITPPLTVEGRQKLAYHDWRQKMNSSDGNLGALIQIRRMGVKPRQAVHLSHNNRHNMLQRYRTQCQIQIGLIRLSRGSSSHRMATQATMGLRALCLMMHRLIDMAIPGRQIHKYR